MRLLLALAWLRWRAFAGGLRRRRKRSRSQRLSGWLDALAGAVLLGTGLLLTAALAAGAFAAGAVMVTRPDTREGLLLALRVLVLSASAMVLVVPLQAASDGHSPTRLLLLPVTRRALHAASLIASALDPFVILVAPAALTLAAGIAWAGAWPAATTALAAGLALIAFLVGLDSLVAGGARLLLKDRRRGEFVALGVLLIVVLASFLPVLLAHRLDPERPGHESATTGAADALDLLDLLPPGLHARAVSDALLGRQDAALARVAVLGLMAAATLAASSAVHARVLSDPSRTSRRQVVATFPRRWRRVPGASDAVVAVAAATIRTSLRNVRGKLATFTPPLVAALMAVVLREAGGGVVAGTLGSAAGLLGWCTALALLNQQPLVLNAFASDGAGFTLASLQPVSPQDLARGKMLAFGALFGLTLAPSIAVAAVLGAPAPLSSWVASVLAAIVTWLLHAPVALLLSARFPKAADLSKLQGQQPHHLAALLGGLALMVTLALPRLAGLAGSLSSPWLAPAAVLACGLAGLVPARLLLSAAALTLSEERERIAMAAAGR